MVDRKDNHGVSHAEARYRAQKPAIERDRAGHFVESNQPVGAQPDLAKENAETRRRAAKSPPKGGEGDKGESRRRKLRT